MGSNDTWIYKNQAISLTLNAGRDLSSASTMTMLVKNPYGYTIQVATTFVSSTAGTIIHTFTTGDLNIAGQWTIKAYEEDEQIVGQNYYLYVRDRWQS